MKRILFLQTKFIPDGPGIVIRNIINHMDTSVFEPVVGCMYHGGELENWYKSQGIRTINFNMKGPLNGWLCILTTKRISEFLKKEHIDLVHTNLIRADIYGRIASYMSGIPVITTVHNTEEHHTSLKLLTSFVRYIDKKTIPLCRYVITVSEAVKNLLCSKYKLPSSKVIVIHNGINFHNHADGMDNGVWSITHDSVVVCTVARLHKQKGISTLVRAIDIILKKGFKVKGVIIGDGPLRKEIAILIQELNVNIALLGFQKDVSPFIRAADIFVLPSLWEGFGLSIVEAMSLSKPIVATRVGGVQEIVADGVTGILCPPGDSEKLAEAIITLIENPELRDKMGVLGKKRAEKYFTAQVMSKKYQEIYRQVLSSNSTARY